MFETHLKNVGAKIQIVGDDTLFDIVFTDKPVRNYRDVRGSDTATNSRFNSILREQGIFKSLGKTYPSLALTADVYFQHLAAMGSMLHNRRRR